MSKHVDFKYEKVLLWYNIYLFFPFPQKLYLFILYWGLANIAVVSGEQQRNSAMHVHANGKFTGLEKTLSSNWIVDRKMMVKWSQEK